MEFENKIMLPLGAIIVGLILDIISLLYNYDNLFSLGMLIIAIALIIICSLLYIELKKFRGEI